MGSGAAETDQLDATRFLPVTDHLRALEPTARIVLGAKGAGKSGLFRQLTDPQASRRLGEIADRHRVRATPLDRTAWVTGFTVEGTAFPPPDVLGRRIKTLGKDFRLAWLALLVRALRSQELGLPMPSSSVAELGDLTASDVTPAVDRLRDEELAVSTHAWLDSVERALIDQDRWLFVVYDDLDVLSPDDWTAVHAGIGELVRFWSLTGRRYQRLQPKLFLRSDIYRRVAVGPDIGKIALGGIELRWTAGDIYALLVKRMVNSSDALQQYLGPAKITFDTDPVFGLIPRERTEGRFAGFAERLVGRFMGAGPRKGYTFRWIPNHLQDGNGLLFPRPAIRLLDAAADFEEQRIRADGEALLHHTSLRGALDEVSEARVRELTEHEYAEFPWMGTLVTTFRQAGYAVPMPRREFERALKEVAWREDATPPTTDPTELAEHLEELGIARRRLDGRFDIGDLYLAGFGLKRKGGVARPQ